MGEIQKYFAHDEGMLALVNVLGIIAGGGFVIAGAYKVISFCIRAYRTSIAAAIRADRRKFIRSGYALATDPPYFTMYAFRQVARSSAGAVLVAIAIANPIMFRKFDVYIGREETLNVTFLASIAPVMLFSACTTLFAMPMISLHRYSVIAMRWRMKMRRLSYLKSKGSVSRL